MEQPPSPSSPYDSKEKNSSASLIVMADSHFKKALACIEMEKAAITEKIDQETNKLRRERDSLEKDKREWKAFNDKLLLQFSDTENVLELNVGGKKFSTLRSTLMKVEGSFLAAMFNGRHPITKDKQGRAFIDRNPRYFGMILEWLRTGFVPTLNEDELEPFELECDFFGLPNLLESIRIKSIPRIAWIWEPLIHPNSYTVRGNSAVKITMDATMAPVRALPGILLSERTRPLTWSIHLLKYIDGDSDIGIVTEKFSGNLAWLRTDINGFCISQKGGLNSQITVEMTSGDVFHFTWEPKNRSITVYKERNKDRERDFVHSWADLSALKIFPAIAFRRCGCEVVIQ